MWSINTQVQLDGLDGVVVAASTSFVKHLENPVGLFGGQPCGKLIAGAAGADIPGQRRHDAVTGVQPDAGGSIHDGFVDVIVNCLVVHG